MLATGKGEASVPLMLTTPEDPAADGAPKKLTSVLICISGALAVVGLPLPWPPNFLAFKPAEPLRSEIFFLSRTGEGLSGVFLFCSRLQNLFFRCVFRRAAPLYLQVT